MYLTSYPTHRYNYNYVKNTQFILNPQVEMNVATDFSCTTDCSSADPRLYDTIRGEHYTLDRPPVDNSLKMKDVYNKSLLRYGTNYTSYSDITAGDITYYINNTQLSPFTNPTFSVNINSTRTDPMETVNQEVERFQTIPYAPIPFSKSPCLSWIRDTTSQREDLISYAQTAIDRQSKNI